MVGFLLQLTFPLPDPVASRALTTAKDCSSATSPKTTCLPSSQLVTTVVMKNLEPLVFGPALAMERSPGLVCFLEKFSSANFSPLMAMFADVAWKYRVVDGLLVKDFAPC